MQNETEPRKYSKHRPSYFTPKIKFTQEEDQILRDAVEKLGTSDWRAVAFHLPNRNPRQCRERWNNYVNPQVSVARPWTPEEDQLLEEKYAELGGKWQTLASFFANRSTNNVKNRFVMLQRHKKGRKPRKCQVAKEAEPVEVKPTAAPVKREVDFIDTLADSLNMDWLAELGEQTLWDW